MAYKAKKYEFVEVVVPGVASGGQTLTRFVFPDLPKLRYSKLQAISSYPVNTIAKTPNGNTTVTAAIMAMSYLVLYSNERQDLYRIPLPILHNVKNPQNDSNVLFLFELNDQQVTWDKCYIEMASSPLNTVNFSFTFGIYYV